MTTELPIDIQTKQEVLGDLVAIVAAVTDSLGYELLSQVTIKEVVEIYRGWYISGTKGSRDARAQYVAKANRLLAWITQDPTR